MENGQWKNFGANIVTTPSNCFYCSKTLDDYERTVDHIIPQSRGGIKANKNKLYCCGDCNKLKGDMMPKEFHRAITSMMRLLGKDHKVKMAYLKRISRNVEKLIDSKKK